MIDAHVHLWQLGANDCRWPTAVDGVLHRDFGLPELVQVLAEADIERAILVQSQESPRDTDWLLSVAAATDRIAGVVGWADLRDRVAVEAMAGRDKLVGLRPMVQDRAGDWFDGPACDAGFACMAEHGLVLEALIRPRHLPSLYRLARRHPSLAIVIDHAAKPEGEAGLVRWQDAIAPLAACDAVHVKLSGLVTELPHGAVASAVGTLERLFGTTRLIWGSDWPVLTVAVAYRDWLELARSLLPPAAHAAVFGANARNLYRLAARAHA